MSCVLPPPLEKVSVCSRLLPPSLSGICFPVSGRESACNAGDLGLIPGFRKMPWRRESLPTPVFWPGEFRGLYISPWGHKESDTTGQLPPAQAEAQLTQENRKGMLLLKATKYLIQVLSRPQ